MNQRTLTLEASYAPAVSGSTPADTVDVPATKIAAPRTHSRHATNDPSWVKILCILVALAFLFYF